MEFFGLTLLVLISTASILLAIWVLSSDSKPRANWWFFVIGISIMLWNLFGFLGNKSIDPNMVLIFFRINYGAVALFLTSFYFFSKHFPQDSKSKYNFADYIIGIIGFAVAFISSISDFVAKSITITNTQKTINMSTLGNIYFLFAAIITLYTIVLLIFKYKSLDQINRKKIQYFLIGIFLFASFNLIFNVLIVYLFPNNYSLTQIGDFSAIFFLGFTAYAIMKHQLFNIKVIATESIVIVLSTGLLVEVFISNNSIIEGIVKAVIWLLATYAGWQLIKSVKHEIKQREELEMLTKKLEEANAHLKEVDKLKDDFLSMASHELNTPIAAIKGYLSMILVEKIYGPVTEKMAKPLDTVYQSSVRLANMVKDLLNVSRIESNRIHIIWEQKPIEDIIEQSITEVMSKAKEAKHTLVFEKPKKKMPLTWFDSTRITEVAINILGNAIKYTPDGGKITARVMSDDNKIVISVEDNGKGIPKEKQKSVFEKFTQVDVLKDEVKGTGLGMYIAKRFIELHKGKIWFHSDGDGKGTTFYFSLPVLNKKPFDPHANEGAVLH